MSDCEWREDPDGVWLTGCGNQFEFFTDGPADNGFSYCAYCGNELLAIKYLPPAPADELDPQESQS